MRIDSSLPAHVARAYGLKFAQPVQSAPTPRVSDVTSKVSSLVAGRVPGGIDPCTTAMPATPVGSSNVLQLYTRAADRVEAATSIQLGRALDVTG